MVVLETEDAHVALVGIEARVVPKFRQWCLCPEVALERILDNVVGVVIVGRVTHVGNPLVHLCVSWCV